MDIFLQEEDRAEYLGKKSNRSPWAPSQNSKVPPGFPLIKLSKWLMLTMPIVALFYTDNAKNSGQTTVSANSKKVNTSPNPDRLPAMFRNKIIIYDAAKSYHWQGKSLLHGRLPFIKEI